MKSSSELEKLIERSHDLMMSVSVDDWQLLHEENSDLLPDELGKRSSMVGVFVMVSVALARLEYPDQVITKELELLRRLYDHSPQKAYPAAISLLERCYKNTKINKEKRKIITKKLDGMNRVIDRCINILSSHRCLCIELECLTPNCGRRVAGHGFLVCGHHHDVYCDSSFPGGLLDWSISQL